MIQPAATKGLVRFVKEMTWAEGVEDLGWWAKQLINFDWPTSGSFRIGHPCIPDTGTHPQLWMQHKVAWGFAAQTFQFDKPWDEQCYIPGKPYADQSVWIYCKRVSMWNSFTPWYFLKWVLLGNTMHLTNRHSISVDLLHTSQHVKLFHCCSILSKMGSINISRVSSVPIFFFSYFFSLNSYISYFLLFFILNSYISYFFRF